VIQLLVTDNAGNTGVDTMTLIRDATPPTVSAGVDKTKNAAFTQT
jgi:hypothetical protein